MRTSSKNQKIVLTFNGKTATLREWAEEFGTPYHTLYSRYKVNQTAEHVLKGFAAEVTPTNAQSQPNS